MDDVDGCLYRTLFRVSMCLYVSVGVCGGGKLQDHTRSGQPGWHSCPGRGLGVSLGWVSGGVFGRLCVTERDVT